MKKISEMNVTELCSYLTATADPAERLFADDAVCTAFDEMRTHLKGGTTARRAASIFNTKVVPILLNDEHRDDVFAIIAAANGKSKEEIADARGFGVIRDMVSVFMTDTSLEYLHRHPVDQGQAE